MHKTPGSETKNVITQIEQHEFPAYILSPCPALSFRGAMYSTLVESYTHNEAMSKLTQHFPGERHYFYYPDQETKYAIVYLCSKAIYLLNKHSRNNLKHKLSTLLHKIIRKARDPLIVAQQEY